MFLSLTNLILYYVCFAFSIIKFFIAFFLNLKKMMYITKVIITLTLAFLRLF